VGIPAICWLFSLAFQTCLGIDSYIVYLFYSGKCCVCVQVYGLVDQIIPSL
jgi:hypothetical protein